MSWHEVSKLDELARRGALVYKRDRHQLAIIHADGRCYAIDNRCPHEGYPLSQGTVDDACVLTCNWHNWKFDLATGKNLLGGDEVRSYPVELRDGMVWVDLSDPPIEELSARLLAGLRGAFDDQDHDWIARQLARMVAAGLDPVTISIPAAMRWSAPRLEYGMTHAFAAAADWLTLHDQIAQVDHVEDRAQLEARLVCLTEAVEHLAHDALRQPEFGFPDPSPDAFDHDRFLDAVEREDAKLAIASIRGALRAGLGFDALERSFSHAALGHYLAFGHALIYTVKSGELIARFGPEVTEFTLCALTRHIVSARREDLIPEFHPLAAGIADYPEQPGTRDDVIPDAEVDALVGAPLRTATAWVHEHARSHTPERVWDALMRANARSMLCFDTRHGDASAVKVADNIGWLDFTHALTFGSAVRRQCARFTELWPAGLLQMACFVARNRAHLDRGVNLDDWRVSDEDAFWAGVRDQLLDHGLPLPIHAVHLLKTSTAVALELPKVAPSTRALLLAALRRFLASPIKQKHARRDVHQAIALVF